MSDTTRGVSSLVRALREQYILDEQIKAYKRVIGMEFNRALLNDLPGIVLTPDVLMRRRVAELRRSREAGEAIDV